MSDSLSFRPCACQECLAVAMAPETARRFLVMLQGRGWRFSEGKAADGKTYFEGRANAGASFISDHKHCRSAALLQAIRHAYNVTFI